MRMNTFFLGVLLLVNGVFGVDADEVSVSVMVGDSVTLHTDITEVPGNSKIIWKFGDEIIARMKEADGNPSTYDGPGALFKDRLKLDKQTGSLTIANIRTEHIGRYSVDIKSTDAKLKTFQVTVYDVVESVSVMKGDSVTLHTGVKVQGSDQIVWKYEDQVIPIAHLNGPDDAKWRNIHLKDQTRDLVIGIIRTNQTGVYTVEINAISMVLHRKYYIAVGVGVKTISVMERDPVNLDTGVTEIRGYDLILWKTEGNIVAEVNKGTNLFGPRDLDDLRFSGRLHLHRETGDLTISDSKTTDSGDYHLHMSNSAYTLQRTIRVIVKTPPQSGAPSGICGAGVRLVVWAVTVFFAARFVDNEIKGVSVNIK
uniref:Immunoglobulin domain-containing protein n=1 Tax=Cyprinus carpio carpio TaxID=630221 RepID=A0A8C0XWD7_CYPCA